MNLLITGAWAGAIDNLERLADMGHEVLFLQQEKDPLLCEPSWVEAVICNGLFQHHPIEQFVNLRYIQLTSAGTDRVPMEYVQQHGIELHNAAGVYSVPMAEFALAGVLQLYKQSRFFAENQAEHRWDKHRGLRELYGKTVCIVGCGSVGTECAKRFQAFGCRVLGVNRTVPEKGGMRADDRLQYYDKIVGMDHLNEGLEQADIVVLSIALTEETRHLIDTVRLTAMKSDSVLVNIARGAIIDQKAMIKALSGVTDAAENPDHIVSTIGGAVLDVFEEEPLNPDSPLWDMDHVILTPHNSFVGDGNRQRLDTLIMGNLR